MTTLSGRPNTALMVIDVQNGVVEGAHRRDAVIANIAQLVDRARDAAVPIVWVQHSDDQLERGSEAWEYVPELARQEPEPLVHKSYGDSFEGTNLEEVLAGAGWGTWWWRGRRRTNASGPRSMAHSCAAMTSPS